MAMIFEDDSLFEGKRYLIVDDFQGMRSMLREMLKSCGAKEMDIASTGNEAIASLEGNKYDVVLCDYNLGSGRNGQQVLEEAKVRNLIGPSTAWVIITAEKTSDLVFGAAEYMPDDYIIKPITESTMKNRLEKVMARKEALREIEKAVHARNFTRAVALCDKALGTSKSNAAELLRIKTGLLLNMGSYDKAKQLFGQILAARDVPWAKTGLAKVAFYSGDLDTARKLLQEVIEQNQAYLEAHDWLARTYEQKGELEEAQQVLLHSTELSPNSLIRQKNLGEIAYKRGDLDTAEKAYRKTIKLGEHSVLKTPHAYLGLAKVCTDKANPNEALQILKDVQKDFHDPEASLHAKVVEGMVYRKSGDQANAKKVAEEVAKLVQEDPNSLPSNLAVEAAQLLLGTGDKETAERLVQTAVKNNHEDEKLVAQVKDVFGQAGMSQEAQQLIEVSRREVVDTNNRGVSLAREGKLDEAIQWLRNAKSLLPNNKRILLNFAHAAVIAMQKSGRNDEIMREARECLEKAVKLDPQEKSCAQLQEMLDALPTA